MMERRVNFFFTPTNISGMMQRSPEQLKEMETYFKSLKKTTIQGYPSPRQPQHPKLTWKDIIYHLNQRSTLCAQFRQGVH